MVYPAAYRILHGEHPVKVVVHLVKKVGGGITAFRNIRILSGEIVRHKTIHTIEQAYGETGIHNIFIIVTGIIPSLGR